MKLNELKDIPIKDYKSDNAGKDFDKVEKPPQEVDRSVRFNVNDYTLKRGKLSANSEKELDTKLDEFLEKTKDRMPTVYNYSSDGKTAFIVYYDKNLSGVDGKYKASLQKKIEEFAKKYSKEEVQPGLNPKSSSNPINNIQKAISTLSQKSLQDLEKYIEILQTRDKYAK